MYEGAHKRAGKQTILVHMDIDTAGFIMLHSVPLQDTVIVNITAPVYKERLHSL